jgi:5-methyltetrahydrofolate--homocysteine methyltransferase
MSQVLEDLKQAIVEGEDDEAVAGVEAALAEGIAALEVLDQAVVAGIEEAGRLWNDNRYFLPDVILSAGAFQEALEVLEPHLKGQDCQGIGRILFGVVEGDMHDLGKNIVTALLTGAGFEIVDLGVNVPVQTFVEKTQELTPDIIGLGAYMTTTMLLMRDVIDGLSANGLRDQVKIMIGGVPTSHEFAEEIGADAWGKDALDAVAKARELVAGK